MKRPAAGRCWAVLLAVQAAAARPQSQGAVPQASTLVAESNSVLKAAGPPPGKKGTTKHAPATHSPATHSPATRRTLETPKGNQTQMKQHDAGSVPEEGTDYVLLGDSGCQNPNKDEHIIRVYDEGHVGTHTCDGCAAACASTKGCVSMQCGGEPEGKCILRSMTYCDANTTWDYYSISAHKAEDQNGNDHYCQSGNQNPTGTICCAASCVNDDPLKGPVGPRCGGIACDDLPGGPDQCCSVRIKRNKNICRHLNDYPCLIPQPSWFAPDFFDETAEIEGRAELGDQAAQENEEGSPDHSYKPTAVDSMEKHECAPPDHHGEEPNAVAEVTVVICLVFAIVLLLVLFEEIVHRARRHYKGRAGLPVVNAMISEVAALGFIGFIIIQVQLQVGHPIEVLSDRIFDEPETLMEGFEWMHVKFFEVGVVYFLYVAWLLWRTNSQMADLERKIEKADKDGDGQVSPEEFVQVFGERELQDPPTHHWVTPGDAYIFTRRLMNVHVPKDQHQKFQTAKWFEAVSGDSLVALVRVPAVIWVILVLPIAIIEFIKIRNFVPGDDIHGCMAGKMLGTPGVVVLLSVVEVALLVWCWYLVAFLSAIKAMVRPRITVNPDTNLHDYHAPALHDEAEIDAYLKRHRFMIFCTDLLARASCNVDSGVDSDGREFTTESVRHHRIFGIAGHNGPPLILKAIKMHTWLTIASLILGLEVINIPDIIALSERGTSGPVVFETILYGIYWFSFLVMLMVFTPEIFELYNLVTSVEGFKRNMQREAIKAGLGGDQPTGGAGVDQAAAAVKQPDAAGLDTKIRRDVLAKNILDNERLREELQQARQQIEALTPKKDE